MFVVRNEAYENSQPFHKHSLMMNEQTFKLNSKGKCFSFEYWSCHGVKLMRKGFNARRSQKCSVLRLSRQTRIENSFGKYFQNMFSLNISDQITIDYTRSEDFFAAFQVWWYSQTEKNHQTRETENQTNILYANTFLPVWTTNLNINISSLTKRFAKETQKNLSWGREATKKPNNDWQKTNVITKNDWKISSIMWDDTNARNGEANLACEHQTSRVSLSRLADQLTANWKNQRRQEATRSNSLIIAECKIIQKQLTFLLGRSAYIDEYGRKVIFSLSSL